MPGLLSWVVTVIHDSKFEASDVFPGPASIIRHPLSVFSFPPPGPAGPVPRLHRYYEGATTSSRPSRRTSFPSFGGTSVALVTFAPRRTSAPPRPGVGHPVSPTGNSPRKRARSPKFLGTHHCPFAHVPIRRRQDCVHQAVAVQQRGPCTPEYRGSHERSFDAQQHGFRTRCLRFAVRITPTPRKTRFQLLVRLYWAGFPPAWFR